MTPRKASILVLSVYILGAAYLLAQSPSPISIGGKLPNLMLEPTPTPSPHIPMEFFGVGPEMFQNRGIAWAKAIGAFIGECISQFGISLVAIFALIKLIRTSGVVDEVQKMKERQDRQGDRLDKVALAVPAVTNGGVTIPNADVKIQPKPEVDSTAKPSEPAQP